MINMNEEHEVILNIDETKIYEHKLSHLLLKVKSLEASVEWYQKRDNQWKEMYFTLFSRIESLTNLETLAQSEMKLQDVDSEVLPKICDLGPKHCE